jgi:hypothetical protein
MVSTPAIRERHGGSLGRWVIGPFVGVAVLIAVATQLTRHGCGGGPGDDPAGVVFEVLTGLAILSSFAVGVWRAVRLIRRNGRIGRVARLVIALLLLAAAAAVADLVSGVTPILGVLFLAALIVGLVVTVTAFVWLLSAVPDRIEADDVGVELPAYLFGFALFVYPFVFLVTVVVAYGCFPN